MDTPFTPNLLERERLESAQGSTSGRAWKWAALLFMFALSFVVFYALVWRSGSDIGIHAAWAAEGDFLRPRTFLRHGAHPLWHVLVAFFMLFGLPVKLAAALVTAALKTAEVWLLHRLMSLYLKDYARPRAITLAAVCCALVSGLWVPWVNPTVYLGVGTPNTWHSPTQMIAMVMMLLCVPYTAHLYAEFERQEGAGQGEGAGPREVRRGRSSSKGIHIDGRSWAGGAFARWRKQFPQAPQRSAAPLGTAVAPRKVAALGAMLFVSLLAKPTLMQAFLPAAGLYFLYQWIRHPGSSRFFLQVLLGVSPAIVFMILQYLFYFGIIVPSQGNMVLELSWEKAGRVFLGALLMRAFPLFALLACARPRDFKNPLLPLTLLLDAVSILEFLLLGEDGRRAADGNFGWATMGAALMLWAVTLPLFLRAYFQAKKAGEGLNPKYLLGFGLLVWHLASGLYYVIYLLTTQNLL